VRVSTTTLEAFRLFLEPDNEWMSEADLVASIRGEVTPSPRMQLGKAFDAVLNEPERFKVSGGYRCEPYAFDDVVMAPCLAVFDRRGLFQVKTQQRYGEIDVVAVADQIVGATVIENKTTTSSFDADKYMASYQWRFLADIFLPKRVTYHVFCLHEDANGYVSLRSIETLNLYPYPALHADCCGLLTRFVDYVTAKGLDAFLRERQRLAEVA
jgi:hypothetical protein